MICDELKVDSEAGDFVLGGENFLSVCLFDLLFQTNLCANKLKPKRTKFSMDFFFHF